MNISDFQNVAWTVASALPQVSNFAASAISSTAALAIRTLTLLQEETPRSPSFKAVRKASSQDELEEKRPSAQLLESLGQKLGEGFLENQTLTAWKEACFNTYLETALRWVEEEGYSVESTTKILLPAIINLFNSRDPGKTFSEEDKAALQDILSFEQKVTSFLDSLNTLLGFDVLENSKQTDWAESCINAHLAFAKTLLRAGCSIDSVVKIIATSINSTLSSKKTGVFGLQDLADLQAKLTLEQGKLSAELYTDAVTRVLTDHRGEVLQTLCKEFCLSFLTDPDEIAQTEGDFAELCAFFEELAQLKIWDKVVEQTPAIAYLLLKKDDPHALLLVRDLFVEHLDPEHLLKRVLPTSNNPLIDPEDGNVYFTSADDGDAFLNKIMDPDFDEDLDYSPTAEELKEQQYRTASILLATLNVCGKAIQLFSKDPETEKKVRLARHLSSAVALVLLATNVASPAQDPNLNIGYLLTAILALQAPTKVLKYPLALKFGMQYSESLGEDLSRVIARAYTPLYEVTTRATLNSLAAFADSDWAEFKPLYESLILYLDSLTDPEEPSDLFKPIREFYNALTIFTEQLYGNYEEETQPLEDPPVLAKNPKAQFDNLLERCNELKIPLGEKVAQHTSRLTNILASVIEQIARKHDIRLSA